MPATHPSRGTRTFVVASERIKISPPFALTFFYRVFCRVLQVLRRLAGDRTELAVELVVLRHEVMVLRGQIARPALQPTDRAMLSSRPAASRALCPARDPLAFPPAGHIAMRLPVNGVRSVAPIGSATGCQAWSATAPRCKWLIQAMIRPTCLCTRREPASVQELTLERRPERLRDCVVLARSDAADRLGDPVPPAQFPEVSRHVLGAADVVEVHPLHIASANFDCHLERPGHELGGEAHQTTIRPLDWNFPSTFDHDDLEAELLRVRHRR